MTIDMTKPAQFTAMQLDLNALTLMCGKNGIGKTLLMKLVWVMSSISNIFIVSGKEITPEGRIAVTQFYLDNTFTDNNLTATIGFTYKDGSSVEIKVDEGKATTINYQLDEKLEPNSHPIYMSSELRKISTINQYMKVKKMLGIPKGISSDDTLMHKLLEMYRLYDIVAAERILGFAELGDEEVVKGLNDYMHEFDEEFVVKGITVDYDNCAIKYQDKDDLWRNVDTLGAGHQALMSMGLLSPGAFAKI